MTPTKLHTVQLIEQCRLCDQQAQLEIYNRYYKAMFNTAFRIIKDSAEAEDVMQDAFLTAFTKLEMLEDNTLFGGWLKKIVINASIAAIRKKQKLNEISLDTMPFSVVEEEEDIALDIKQVKIQTLLTTLQQLKQSYSTVLSLHFIEGYDYEEICDILSISYANCRTLISRAKESLRKKLITV